MTGISNIANLHAMKTTAVIYEEFRKFKVMLTSENGCVAINELNVGTDIKRPHVGIVAGYRVFDEDGSGFAWFENSETGWRISSSSQIKEGHGVDQVLDFLKSNFPQKVRKEGNNCHAITPKFPGENRECRFFPTPAALRYGIRVEELQEITHQLIESRTAELAGWKGQA